MAAEYLVFRISVVCKSWLVLFDLRSAQILRNVASNPEDPRFRRIKRDNENFQRALGRFEGGIQILLSSGFRMQVEEGQTVLVMNEPDLSEDMDGWTEWYKNITEAVERLKLELDERF